MFLLYNTVLCMGKMFYVHVYWNVPTMDSRYKSWQTILQ